MSSSSSFEVESDHQSFLNAYADVRCRNQTTPEDSEPHSESGSVDLPPAAAREPQPPRAPRRPTNPPAAPSTAADAGDPTVRPDDIDPDPA